MAIRSVFGNRDNREKKNLANREYYKTLVDNKKEATFLSDADGDLFLLNKKAQLLSGYGEEDIRDFHVRDLFVTLKKSDNPFDSNQFSEFTSRLYLIDARRYLIPVLFDFKEIEGQKFLCTCVEAADDETPPAQQGEVTLQEPPDLPQVLPPASKPDHSPRFTVDFEHQIRSHLNSILGFGSILTKDPGISADKKLSGHLDSIIRSGNNLKKLFNQTTLGDGEDYELNRTTTSLSPVLQKAVILVEPLARHNSITIHVKPHADVTIITDESLLLEMLRFLLGKAVTYTRNEAVMVEIKEDRKTGKAIVLIDNLGQDIPQGVINFIRREHSKDQYDLTNPVIAPHHDIVRLLHSLNRIDGRISFTTGINLGETAQIDLPLAPDAGTVDDLAILENSIRSKSLNILIVEDEKFTAQILRLYLEDLAQVSLAYSGNEALNIAEIFYNKGILFHAVIMDIGLPKPWDGILLKNEIQKRWPEYANIPFLAQTAFTSKSYTDRIREQKFTGHLIKPVNRNEVLRFIDRNCK